MENAEKTVVCVLTGRQTAAIGSVALAGKGAAAILQKVFRSAKPAAGVLEPGTILHGTLVDDLRTVDRVVVGCETNDCFVVHCHGNPLITEQAVRLFEQWGASLLPAEEFLIQKYRRGTETCIEAEAELWKQKAATLTGVKIIANQVTAGLLPTVRQWLDGLDDMTLEQLWSQCHQVLRKSTRAQYLIHRCKVTIVGPPNSGKSTLLNRLAGDQRVIVSDTAGTTRDWVSITCRLGPLLAEIYDTAGLDASLMQEHGIDKMAQEATLELVRSADINLFVYDAAKVRQAQLLLFNLGSLKAVIAANKCDLLLPHQKAALYSKYIPVSAKTGEGLDRLVQMVAAALKVDDFDTTAPVCFTDRQLAIVRELIHVKEKEQARELLLSLLRG